VFLIQGLGQRRWQLGGKVADDAAIIPGIDLRILERFEIEPGDDWVLEPGDMLYLPPGWAHHGVSQSDDCMTYSVGFRAPSADEAITSFADYLGEQLPASIRYSDAGMALPATPAELDDASLARMRKLILDTLDNPNQLAQWFGRAMTQPKYVDQLIPAEHPTDVEALVAELQAGEVLVHSLGSRFAWRDLGNGNATLFVDGDAIECALSLAQAVAAAQLDADILEHEEAAMLLGALLDAGSLAWLDDEEDA
ncbi:MAG: cupin domain-containing protein, partial [Halomonadaceae bacterium]|nr:cupin domain-containing protein [Halomonadaceae bacterium]